MNAPRANRPTAVIFDWDNTLVDNWESIRAALNAALAAMDQPTWTLAETKARVRESLRDSFPRMFGDRWTEAREIFYATFRAEHLATLRPIDGADRFLRMAHADGLYLGVVSNKQGDLLREEAEHLGWTGLFRRLVGATDAARDKPAPDPVHLALSAGGPDPGGGVWFVGDAAIDMECAHAAGCLPVLIGSADPGDAAFRAAPPARHIPDFTALAELVRNPEMTIS